MSPDGTAPPGETPHDPWMDARVTRLEDDMGEIKTTLRRLEPMIVRLDAVVPHLATKADLTSEISAVRTDLTREIAAVRTDLTREIIAVRTDLTSEIAAVRTEIGMVRKELTAEIGVVRKEVTMEIGAVRKDLSTDIRALQSDVSNIMVELADKPSRTYMWVIVLAMVTAFGCGLAGLAILK